MKLGDQVEITCGRLTGRLGVIEHERVNGPPPHRAVHGVKLAYSYDNKPATDWFPESYLKLVEHPKRCNKCLRPMKGTTAYDGACECGGLIESVPHAE